MNLRDNLHEEVHYTIVNEEIWFYFWNLYGGWEIKRFGVVNDSGESSIDVNYLKVYAYFFPLPANDQHIDKLYISKNCTLEDLMKRME